MKKFSLFLLLLLLSIITACGQPATPSDIQDQVNISINSWQENYDLGIRYLSEGKYQEAIIAFTAAIEIDPKRAEAYIGRGDAYLGSGETEENLAAALLDYEVAVSLDKSDAVTLLKIADIYIVLGAHEDEAITAFTAAIIIDPENPTAYIGRGDIYASLGETDELLTAALADYEKALSLDENNSSIYNKIADIYIARADLEKLQEILGQAASKFGETEDIADRQHVADTLQSNRTTELLTATAWDTSVQTSEYTFLFEDGHGICINGAFPGIAWVEEEVDYTIEGNSVRIIKDSWRTDDGILFEDEWTLDTETQRFSRLISEEDYTTKVWLIPISAQEVFSTLASVPSDNAVDASYWEDLLNLILLYNEKTLTQDEANSLRLAQEDWQLQLNQEIADGEIDMKTTWGNTWVQYCLKKRVYELLALPFSDSKPPIYVSSDPTISEDDAMLIAQDFWDVAPKDGSPLDAYETYVVYQGTVEQQGQMYYYFMLKWWVADPDFPHGSTVDILYVDAQTGECHQ